MSEARMKRHRAGVKLRADSICLTRAEMDRLNANIAKLEARVKCRIKVKKLKTNNRKVV